MGRLPTIGVSDEVKVSSARQSRPPPGVWGPLPIISISPCRLSVRRTAAAARRPLRAAFNFKTAFRSVGALTTFVYGDAHDFGDETLDGQTDTRMLASQSCERTPCSSD